MTTRTRDIHELADEYVLGLLDATEAAEIEARVHDEPDLRAAIGESRDRFVELDLAGEAAPVSADLWERIAGHLPASAPEPAAAPYAPEPAPAAAAPVAANDDAAGRWRRAAIGAMAACLLLAIGLGWSLTHMPEPRVVAVLMNEAGEPLVLVEDFGDASARIVPLTDFDVPRNRTMQVWTKPSEEMGPVSLGLLDENRTQRLEGPDLPAPRPNQLYEITLEPEGGSPTGRPTGPILVKGFAKIPL